MDVRNIIESYGNEILSPFSEMCYGLLIEYLDRFFLAQFNYRDHTAAFEGIRQKEKESFTLFLIRLKRQVIDLDIVDATARENKIREQIRRGARHKQIRDIACEKLLSMEQLVDKAMNIEANEAKSERDEEDKNRTHHNLLNDPSFVAAVQEKIWTASEGKRYEKKENVQGRGYFHSYPSSSRGKVGIGKSSGRFFPYSTASKLQCFGCGYSDHKMYDNSCPARNAKCFHCNKVGHFSRMCRAKQREEKSSLMGDNFKKDGSDGREGGHNNMVKEKI